MRGGQPQELILWIGKHGGKTPVNGEECDDCFGLGAIRDSSGRHFFLIYPEAIGIRGDVQKRSHGLVGE